MTHILLQTVALSPDMRRFSIAVDESGDPYTCTSQGVFSDFLAALPNAPLASFEFTVELRSVTEVTRHAVGHRIVIEAPEVSERSTLDNIGVIEPQAGGLRQYPFGMNLDGDVRATKRYKVAERAKSSGLDVDVAEQKDTMFDEEPKG